MADPDSATPTADPPQDGPPQEVPAAPPIKALEDITPLVTYLRQLCPVVFDADPAAFEEALRLPSTTPRLTQFATDKEIQVLLVQKIATPQEEAADKISYAFSTDVVYTSAKTFSIAFQKRAPVLEAGRSIAAQLHFIDLGEDKLFETLHGYMHAAFTPIFNSFVAKAGKLSEADSDQKTGIGAVKKKLAELELSLLQVQQEVDIPEVNLPVDQEIRECLARCKSNGKRMEVEDLGDIVEQSDYLASLQTLVNVWIREIQKVTKLDRDPATGTATQEITFWLSLERALNAVTDALKAPGIEMTLAVLKHAKRFHATVSFDTDTGLKTAIETVTNYNLLMKDFPMNELLGAPDIPRIGAGLKEIFGHLKKLRNTRYPIERALRLGEAISRALLDQILRVLNQKRLLAMPFDEFDRLSQSWTDVFTIWEELVTGYKEMCREVARKRRNAKDERLPIRVNPSHTLLQERLERVTRFRTQHEELRGVINKVLPPGNTGGLNALEEIMHAFEDVRNVDPLDISPQGQEAWETALVNYEARIDRVETQITAKLRDRLGASKNANEMFRVFKKFNALLFRPRVKAAILEYQGSLIQRVRDDIRDLQEKFRVPYEEGNVSLMSRARDLPPISGAVVWARQIERQLNHYLESTKHVLPQGEEQTDAHKQLQAAGETFAKKLNVTPMVEAWIKEVESKNLDTGGSIYVLRKAGNTLSLDVNFDRQLITLFKEVRNLQAMGFRVAFSVQLVSTRAQQAYPNAVAIMETMRSYRQTCERVHPGIQPLVAAAKLDCQTIISEGFALHWEAGKLESYVKQLAESVVNFQEKVDDLIVHYEEANKAIKALGTCQLSETVLTTTLGKVQKIVDQLSLASYSNLETWVAELDARVASILTTRLEEAVKVWVAEFSAANREEPVAPSMSRSRSTVVKGAMGLVPGAEAAPVQRADMVVGGKSAMRTLVHEIALRNQVMFVEPPLEQARTDFIDMYNTWLGLICKLPRIRSSFDAATTARSTKVEDYEMLLARIPREVLQTGYAAIEALLVEARAYVGLWLQYQALWDVDPSALYDRLQDNLGAWQQVLVDIKKSRSTFDTNETHKRFGPLTVDYENAQSKVNIKYDAWHKDVLGRFGARIGERMGAFHQTIKSSRILLERSSIETESTAAAVAFITSVQDMKRKLKQWAADLEGFRNGCKLLERQRFRQPPDWLAFDQVEGEWSSFTEILARKDRTITSQIPTLQKKILAEDEAIARKVQEIHAEWEKEKPISGNLTPEDANKVIGAFDDRIRKVSEEYDLICKAKDALDLEAVATDVTKTMREELADLKEVWAELAKVWTAIEDLKQTPWSTVAPKKLRQQLEDLGVQLKGMPNRMRQYQAWEFAQNMLRQYVKANAILSDMKSEAIRERHWKQFGQKLKVNWTYARLTLGELWDVDVVKNETLIREVITIAQGEMALEEFLRQVKEYWQQFNLDLVQYQKKCKLIRGWDDLFNKLLEHLNSLSAMKGSPYFKPFAEDAEAWEDKLNKIRAAFDVWIDVQRRWVYLDGIFSGSADIAILLPQESSRFKGVDTEFVKLMKQVQKTPGIVEVIAIKGLLEQLEKFAENLTKIQKALGEYLERQRLAFPRFYFVGDEDLLEIIGNSKEISKIQKHLKKMFAGLNSLMLEENDTIISGMMSAQAEEVLFRNKIDLKAMPKINEWLTAVEKEMMNALACELTDGVLALRVIFGAAKLDTEAFFAWVDRFPAQLVTLCTQAIWTESVEAALAQMENGDKNDHVPLDNALARVMEVLTLLAETVLQDLPANRRRKYEHLITEMVHQRDTIRKLIAHGTHSGKDFDWLYEMRYYFDEKNAKVLERLELRMANTKFFYGYEYLGIIDKLVQTPLTDRCYLTLTQALDGRYGGSPFGPAGTGKTETVKALGAQMGRFVLVFCCDETFDYQSMGRILVGLCQVGAWGCFDEFNRLQERMLSAVSQQIQTISKAMKEDKPDVELLGSTVKLNKNIGVFITMNPGYAGRSNLPDNLKQLFRSIAMTLPNKELIGEVMLYAQGFSTAERLSGKVIPLFKLCGEQLSAQSHYDFGLRSLKSVLVSAGNIKRMKMQAIRNDPSLAKPVADMEADVMIQSVCETLVPKLVAADIPLLYSLLSDVFPGVQLPNAEMLALRAEIRKLCVERHYVYGDLWVQKLIQLNQILNLNHGVMLVGPSGSGKTAAWKTLLKALERLEKVEGVSYVLDPKAISKDELYGFLDPTTREWTDGLFTNILRKIIDNVRGESTKRHWVIFDGDVDPEWVENMNSLLDDNKLLTLPNGERLALPSNVRIMFEVQDLKYATLATVSRCGMVWFSEETLDLQMIFENYLMKLRNVQIEAEGAKDSIELEAPKPTEGQEEVVHPAVAVQRQIADILAPFFQPGALVEKAMTIAMDLEQIMDFTRLRVLGAMFSLVNGGIAAIHQYNNNHADFPMRPDHLQKFITKRLIFSLVWGFSGSSKISLREQYGDMIKPHTDIPFPAKAVIDYEVDIESGEWEDWSRKVPVVDVDPKSMGTAIIQTLDTVRHVEVLYAWLAEHKPLLLCGPPGSGKTMTLFSTLRKCPDYEVCGINFSSSTTPDLILKTFEQKCEIKRTANGLVMQPTQMGKWLVVFCDEINLPAPDNYGTQRVITFLRQLVEQNGFWRAKDLTWITLERIMFVGACNPPTDPGRTPLTYRFLRHAPLILCDYPAYDSLRQIYGTFARGLLRHMPDARDFAAPLTECMVEFFTISQNRFVPDTDMHQHYIYSPRELTRWVRGIYEAVRGLDSIEMGQLVRLWAHEGLRLFQDRLVTVEEREWTDQHIDLVANKYFPGLEPSALQRPILFSNWLSNTYTTVDRESLRGYVEAKLKVFHEEVLDIPLVLFNEVLDNVLRTDRVFNQKQGHLLLIGQSGAGKTILSRFVAWMNGLSVFTIRGSRKYSGEDFDEDLRTILRRSGAEGERMCFIFDESNIKDTGFLERMNTLLANGEIPGLFEGEEYNQLMATITETAQKGGKRLDSEDEKYNWFTDQIIKNLHVVFTMNPASGGFENRTSTSPALFNRCVLNWVGDWSNDALYQVALEFTEKLDIGRSDYTPGDFFPFAVDSCPRPPSHREAVVNAMVFVHQSVERVNSRLAKTAGKMNYSTPRHYLDFIHHYCKLFNEKRDELAEQQLHLNVGLEKLVDTERQVTEMQKTLAVRGKELETKNEQANEKLKQMVKDQQEAEIKKTKSQEIAKELAGKMVVIDERKAIAMADLAKAEPAVESAAQAVKGIKKSQLDELRALANPPAGVKLALESVSTLLGETSLDWADIRKVIRKDDFITNVSTFDTNSLTERLRTKVRRDYISKDGYDFETINKASKACGPLVKWVIAQCDYGDILERVEPLRKELAELEAVADEMKLRQSELDKMIDSLERSIAGYKDEYAALISEVQRIKSEMETTTVKVSRSTSLLGNLSGERRRWEGESEGFKTQMATVVGDVLICAAFMAYSGFFDQKYRAQLFKEWKMHLTQAGISFKADLSTVEYLSIPDERLLWQANALPADDLCNENAIMLKRCNRYPLIVDPSGQATTFVMNQFKDKKIAKTSFLDPGFMKNLESALRFGTPLLVQDVENVDPVINPILNRELRKTGGRVLMQLGEQDIDFSPTFSIILTTRDPAFNFPPDLNSRVTFVNFTVTPGSLQSQCLNRVLKSERPDVDQKRSDLLKLQGEFRVKLRQLEARLLKALSEAEGSILDNDTVIATLETLKREAADITQKVAETDTVMAEVSQVSNQYTPMATSCARVYFALEQLPSIHFLYQFSLKFFLDIFQNILANNPNLKGITDFDQRLSILVQDLFTTVFQRCGVTLMHEDHLCLALLLAQIRVESTLPEGEFDFLLKGAGAIAEGTAGQVKPLPKGLFNTVQEKRVSSLMLLPSFRSLAEHVGDNGSEWREFIASPAAETCVPVCWVTDKGPKEKSTVAFRKLLVVRAVRPDRVLAATSVFIASVFGDAFLETPVLNFRKIVESEVESNSPVLLCSQPGYDASGRVDDLAGEMNKKYQSIALGSAEGFDLAEKAINGAVKSGTWVMLKNVHLAPQWLVQLEKKLHNMAPVAAFRLFLTTEIHPALPGNLLRMSRVMVFEPPPGVKANLLRTFNSIPASRMDREPVERSRLYFLVAWLHAVVQERLRYQPLGWAGSYEFNDSDQRCAVDMMDYWIERLGQGRSNIDPDKITWDALRKLMSQSIYGGKIDNSYDARLLESFLNELFTPRAFSLDYELVHADEATKTAAIMIPAARNKNDFLGWIQALPEQQTPAWIGLPINAETVLLSNKGNEMVTKVLKMQSMQEDDDDSTPKEPGKAVQTDTRPAWMRSLHTSVLNWAKLMPKSLTTVQRTEERLKDPLFRCLDREMQTGKSLLNKIKADLAELDLVCKGETKQTNYLRDMLAWLSKGIVPKTWKRFPVPKTLPVAAFLLDIVDRLKQLERLASPDVADFGKSGLELGKLFVPEAYVTASRQAAAQSKGWSLEELVLTVQVDAKGALDGQTFVFEGLMVEGAEWKSGALQLSTEMSTRLPPCRFRWIHRNDLAASRTGRHLVNVPVYLNEARSETLFAVDIDAPAQLTEHDFFTRGIAITCTNYTLLMG